MIDPATRKFENLHEARDELWRLLCRLESVLEPLHGGVAAAQTMLTGMHEDLAATPKAGLRFVLDAAQGALDDLEGWSDELEAAVKVVRQNDPRLLSEAAVNRRLRPYLEEEERAEA